MSFVWTDDPDDPCSLDVQWMTADGRNDFDPYEFFFEEAVPFLGPDKPAERLYRWVHDDCERAAIQYTSEAHA